MERARDDLAKEANAVNWMDLQSIDIKTLAQMAVDEVWRESKCVKHRMDNPKNPGVIGRKAETKFLIELLAFWFGRKWQEAQRQAKLPPRDRRKARCSVCNTDLRCPTCHPIPKDVFPLHLTGI